MPAVDMNTVVSWWNVGAGLSVVILNPLPVR
jgi:hypothetical protein